MKQPEGKRPFAAFDIDGTLIRWQLYHAISDQLARAGRIDPKSFEAVRTARMTWKKRTAQNSFSAYEQALVRAYEAAIVNISEAELMAAVHAVFAEYKDQTYAYTRDLVKRLKAEGYLLFAISASQAEIVKLLADYYGFDDFGGSVYEKSNGRFTGQKKILKSDQKPICLHRLIAKHHASSEGSLAVGDSESDIPMLEIVEKPIAFNPNQLLFHHARQRKWQIVVERKNMIYELGPANGSYLLA